MLRTVVRIIFILSILSILALKFNQLGLFAEINALDAPNIVGEKFSAFDDISNSIYAIATLSFIYLIFTRKNKRD